MQPLPRFCLRPQARSGPVGGQCFPFIIPLRGSGCKPCAACSRVLFVPAPEHDVGNHKRHEHGAARDGVPERHAHVHLVAYEHAAQHEDHRDDLDPPQHGLFVIRAVQAAAVRRLEEADRIRRRAVGPGVRRRRLPLGVEQLQKADPERLGERLDRVDIRKA